MTFEGNCKSSRKQKTPGYPPCPLDFLSLFCAYSNSVAIVLARLDSLAHTIGLGQVSASAGKCVIHAERSSAHGVRLAEHISKQPPDRISVCTHLVIYPCSSYIIEHGEVLSKSLPESYTRPRVHADVALVHPADGSTGSSSRHIF